MNSHRLSDRSFTIAGRCLSRTAYTFPPTWLWTYSSGISPVAFFLQCFDTAGWVVWP